MRNPIAIAMALSVVFHIAIFVFVEWLLAGSEEPSVSGPVPLVIVQPAAATNGSWSAEQIAGHKAIKRPDHPTAIERVAPTVAARKMASYRRNPKSAPAPSGPASPVHTGPGDGGSRGASPARDESIDEPEVMTTKSRSEPAVSVTRQKKEVGADVLAPMSSGQEAMLNGKLKEWTENFRGWHEADAVLTWSFGDQDYIAEFIRQAADDDMGLEYVTVKINTEENGKRLTAEMRMKRLSFSNYAQFVHRWDTDVQFHDDELDGRFHSNSRISLAYSRKVKPQFHGKVTTSSRRIDVAQRPGYLRRDEIFLGGLQTGVRTIRLPKHFLPFPRGAEQAGDRIHRFQDDTRITFNGDGSYTWQTIESGSPQHKVTTTDETYFLVAERKVKLYVEGTVNGKLLVYSPDRIVIEGDLVYAQDPAQTADADDYLGLVSDKYVDVAPPDVTGPGDLKIDAAIYARRRFAVKGYRFRNKGQLRIYGSLTAGSMSATEPRYSTRIRFDRRLERLRPPRFPMTDRYAPESWDPVWRVEPIETLRGDVAADHFQVQ